MPLDKHAHETTPLGDSAGANVTKQKRWDSGRIDVAWTSWEETGLVLSRQDVLPAFESLATGNQTPPGRPTRRKRSPGGNGVNAMPATDPVEELAKKPYLTRKEAAALARISTWTLDGFAREPDFPMLRLGQRVRVIPTEAFLAWLKVYSERLANPLTPPPAPSASRTMRGRR